MKFTIPRARLRTRIIAWSFIPTTIILFAVALVVFYAYQQVTQDLVVGRNQELTRLSAGQLATSLTDYAQTLTTLARTSDIYRNDPAAQSAALQAASNRLIAFDAGVVLLNHLGRVTATEPGRPEVLGQDWSNRSYFRDILRSAPLSFSDIAADGAGGAQVIALAVPVLSDRGEFRGTMVGMFRLGATGYSSFYASIVKLRLGESSSTYLVDGAGRVIYHPDPQLIGTDVHAQPLVQQVLKRQVGSLRTHDVDNGEMLATFAPVPGTPWGLINEESWTGLLEANQGYAQFLLLLLGLGVIVPAVVVTFGVKRITDPVAKLMAAAKEIAGGKFGQQVTVHTGDELEELAGQFNAMSVELAGYYRTLKEREERFALVIEGTNDGIWDWDLLTDQVYFSPRWKAMLGYAEGDLANCFEAWQGLMHPDEVGPAMERLQAYLNGQTPVYQLEQRLRHKDGSYRWVLARGLARRDAAGKAYRMAGSHTDITERKRAEEAIRQSEKRFSQVFHASPIPISITALADGRYVEVNDAWLSLFGYSREQVIGSSSLKLNIWVEPGQRAGMIERLQATGSLRDFEHLAQTGTGEVRDVLVSAEVIELNNVPHNLSLVYDITERKQAQQALERRVAERTHELATLNAVAAVASRSLDLHEILGDTLDKIMQVLGMEFGAAYRIEASPGEAVPGSTLRPMVYRGFSDALARYSDNLPYFGPVFMSAREAAAEGAPIVLGVQDATDEPGLKQVLEQEGIRLIISVPLTAKGQLVGALNVGTRNPRTVAPEELSLLAAIGQQIGVAVENARLYDKAEQSAAAAERSRLARELHDSVTQSLYSVTMYAEAAALALTAGQQPTAVDHLRELRDTAQEALREMRLLIFELRPLALEQRGLADALRARLDAVEGRGGMKTELQVEGAERLPLAVQQEVYHIVQEALNNVIKHAHAQRVRVHLVVSDRLACLEIADDGLGFDPAQPRRGGLGLSGLRERAERIGGRIEITSSPGKGTTINVTWGGC